MNFVSYVSSGYLQDNTKPLTNVFDGDLDNLSIEVPKMYEFFQVLKSHGVIVPHDKVKTIGDLAKFLAERRGNSNE